MDPKWVLVQALAVVVLGGLGIYATGDEAGHAIAIGAAACLGLWLTQVAWFLVRVPRSSWGAWAGPVRIGGVAATLAFVPLCVLGTAVARSDGFDGRLWADNTAAAFAAVCVTVIPAAMLMSSLIDNYVILPAVLGLRGDALWHDVDEDDNPRRRRLAQVWVAHRGISELIIFPAIALVLAIPIVAAGNFFGSDPTLPAVFESLGGAGVAFAVFGFARPRWKDALEFAQSAPVGIGSWVHGKDLQGKSFQGLVIDVSVHPGLKIIAVRDNLNERIFIPLDQAKALTPRPRPPSRDNSWAREQALTHLLKISAEDAAAWPGPPA